MRDAEATARASLLRSTVVFSALLALTLAGLVWIVTHAASGAVVITLAFAAIVAALLAHYVIQHLRDLRAAPVEREGVVTRKWSRADLIVAMQSYYITLDRTVFRIEPEQYIHLKEGDRARVVHFPHTLHVISLERIAPVR